ncbi:MAG: hypothetical protein ACRD43_05920, partial [Pyrinomonadaceae bacterium]
MKSTIYKVLGISAFIILALNLTVIGQTPEVEKAQAQVNKILEDSGRSFRAGLQALKENRKPEAGDNFDKAVEQYLLSTLNVQKEPRMRECYNGIIQTVYLIEFPTSQQPPKIRELSATCGWAWNSDDLKLADDVVAMNKPAANKSSTDSIASVVTTPGGLSGSRDETVGFNDQSFEPSPLDDLAKLELTTDEQDVNSPTAQAQYQYIQYAVANKSLGFSFQVHPMIQQFVNY